MRCTASPRNRCGFQPDKLTYRFTLRPEARFHDGSKLTAHDVAFSLTTLKTKGSSTDRGAAARHGEGRGARRRDAGRHLRRKARARRAALCREPADLLEGLLRDAAVRRIDARYPRWDRGRTRSGKFEVNRYIEFERVKDWWGAELPVNRGSYNFDIVRYEFYAIAMSRSKALAARAICSARSSRRASGPRATTSRRSRTAGSSAKHCRMKRRPARQGWFFNTRRDKFRDPRVREAIDLARSISNGPTRP